MGRIVLPYPHTGQQLVMEQSKRFNWLCAGRRWRKTTLLAAIAVEAAIEGKDVLWGAPVYDQVWTAWEECMRSMWDVAVPNQGRMTLSLPGRGRIMFRSLDNPRSVRSKTADLVIVDEAGDVDPEAWSSVLRPLLTSTGGGAWMAGTPRGLNWFWEGWEGAATRPDSARWQAPTVGMRIEAGQLVREPHPLENPDMPFEEMLSAFEETPEAKFREEYMADWMDSGDAVFKTADIEAMPSGWNGLMDPARGRKYLHAWDIGRRSDATVGGTIDHTYWPWQLVAFERFQGLPYPAIQDAIEKRHKTYGGRTVVESNGVGDPVIENLAILAEPFVTTARSKVDGITALQLVMERGALKANIPQVTREMKAYRWDDRTLTQDCVMMLAIAAACLPRPARTGGARLYTPDTRKNRATIIGARQTF